MLKAEFTQILKDINLSKKEFANLSNVSYNTINNWSDETRPVPPWVASWLENYIKSKSYEDIKRKVFDIENIHEIAIEKIFNETDPRYKEQAIYTYRDTLSVDKTIKMIKIASSINRDAGFLNKCSDSDINKLYAYLEGKNFKPNKKDESMIIDLMNGKGLTI